MEEDRFNKWSVNPNLRKSMQNCLRIYPRISEKEFLQQEKYWAIYWYQNWQSNQSELRNIAKIHLQAYLQESCYLLARKKAVATISSNSLYGFADFFQMANAEVETVLENFDINKSSGLKEYFSMAMRSRIRDILRQRNEADLCSDWGLLRKISRRVLEKALKNAGFGATKIAQYCLAWKCLNQLYVTKQPKGTRQLPKPDAQLWQVIANLYNDSRYMLDENIPPCTAQTIESILEEAATRVRSYKFPIVRHLSIFNSDSNNQAVENLVLFSENSPIADMIASEEFQIRQNQTYQICELLSASLKALDTQCQEIFRFYYREKLTQQQIVQELGISQPMISRKLRKGRQSLLQSLFEWSQNLNIFVNPNQIRDMSNALEEWLQNHL